MSGSDDRKPLDHYAPAREGERGASTSEPPAGGRFQTPARNVQQLRGAAKFDPNEPTSDVEPASTLSEVQQEICRRIMEGESVRAIGADPAMPSKSTIMSWLARDPEFRAAYALAKQLLAETLAEEVREISDTPQMGIKTTTKPDGTVETVEGDMIEHRRLQVDSRKWLAAKLAPKRYGDSSMLRVGEIGDQRDKMSPGEMVARLAAIAAKYGRS